MLTKLFVKIVITKTFCYNNKIFSSVNKTFDCCSEFLVAATKNLFVVPNFAATKPFFPCIDTAKSFQLDDCQTSCQMGRSTTIIARPYLCTKIVNESAVSNVKLHLQTRSC